MDNEKNSLSSQLKSQHLSVGILASNWLQFEYTLDMLLKNNIKLLHFDIADGQFSPLFTVGSMALKFFEKPFIKDVHLMVKDQLNVAKNCVTQGADIITLQLENTTDLKETLMWLKTQPKTILCGVSLCPDTSIDLLDPYLSKIDLIQLLTLDPRTGQKVGSDMIKNKLSQLFDKLEKLGHPKLVSVDGAMTFELATSLKEYPINWVVSGSAIFSSAELDNSLTKWTTIHYNEN